MDAATCRRCPRAGRSVPVANDGWTPPVLDTRRPHPARMYDYYLGGKDNYPVDRVAAEKALKIAPALRTGAQENRTFMQRAVRFLVGEVGIRQIIDIGSGMPTASNIHEIAQEIAPDTRVLYVDEDPIVHVHTNAILSDPRLTTAIRANLRDPDSFMNHSDSRSLIDFTRPIAVLLGAVLHYVKDEDNPGSVAKCLREEIPAGSHLVISHATAETQPEAANEVTSIYADTALPITFRGYEEILSLFDGFELVAPGLVPVQRWRTGTMNSDTGDTWLYGGIARKPLKD